MLRVIREVRPKWVVGENVLGIVNWNGGLVFDEVQSDLESQGYEVQTYVLPACSVNAPHRRDRVWFVAHTKGDKNQRHGQGGFYTEPSGLDEQRFASDPDSIGVQGQPVDTGASQNAGQRREGFEADGDTWGIGGWENFPTTEPTIRGGDDGLSGRLDGITFSKWRNESIKAYGNAVVPQVVYQIFKAIEQYEKL